MTRFGILAPLGCVALAAGALYQASLFGSARSTEAWILADSQTGKILEAHWDDIERPIPLGSLVKPFAALAYADGNSFSYPEFECSGDTSRCWLPAGHGRTDIYAALAHSCNAYFRLLTDFLQFDDVARVSSRFGLPAPTPPAQPGTYFGLGARWRISPLDIMRAYGELVRRREQPGVGEIVQALELAASVGTASGLGRVFRRAPVLAKTGTAPCVHHGGPAGRSFEPSNGDGYVIVLYPADRPRYTLLLQAHGLSGRRAADIGGRLLRKIVGAAR